MVTSLQNVSLSNFLDTKVEHFEMNEWERTGASLLFDLDVTHELVSFLHLNRQISRQEAVLVL